MIMAILSAGRIRATAMKNTTQPSSITDSDQAASAVASLHPDIVRTQLERLLHSAHFADAPRLTRFLKYIVEESLAGRGDRLKGYAIAIDVFDRPTEFDPLTDTIVRVQAGQLRRRLALYYANEGRDDPLCIAVPKGGYAPAFVVMFDEVEDHGSSSGPHRAIASTHASPTIAVLPFENASRDPSHQYFADGLTMQTVANLARFRHLDVLSRWTTAGMTGGGPDVARLREELAADFMVEGTLRKSKDAIRVTFQLAEVATGTVISSEQLERTLRPESLFVIQDEIALMVAARIADRYGPLERSLERSHRQGESRLWETYYWITRFYAYHADRDPAAHFRARDGLTRTLMEDPDSSDGWAALSIIRLDEYRFQLNLRPEDSALDAALDHALKAVACDPESAFAHQALAMAHFYRHDDDNFRITAQRALDLNPGHADALADIGICYSVVGDFDKGLPLMDRAIELSPVHPDWYRYPKAWYLASQGDFSTALVEIKQATSQRWFWHLALLAWFHAELGDEASSSNAASRLLAQFPEFPSLARQWLRLGRFQEALVEKAIAGWRKAGLEIAD